ncbi:MAG TPA: 1-(5-phosphoribosyl)-5-[(5-phosphoribosylamino)methylideneamino]imidazole-4-carboxamide isomerase [Candidatus Paceibacterota bacterium]|nr:1-(5-phosphoribosyl)-5-[(5-phosphoribosylamino)methylideneamino]imidazole-4-carboxamide isomerase [Candidatus Paceibacterota bacterium]
MEIIPAIDIQGGRCVRLTQGIADKPEYYGTPTAAAKRWTDAGAKRLHVIDLDAARSGKAENFKIIHALMQQTSVHVQVGGGLRSSPAIGHYRTFGADRVVISTAAVTARDTFKRMAKQHAPYMVVSIDTKDGAIAIEGWSKHSTMSVHDLILLLSDVGITRIVYTDISRDGTLAGPNLHATERVVKYAEGLMAPMHVLAAGGVKSIEHIRQLKQTGVEGVIVGKALYAGTLDLKEALAVAQ